jgi:hypothetical protein
LDIERRVSTTVYGLQESLYDDIECLLQLSRNSDSHALVGDAETAHPRIASHAIEVSNSAVVQSIERDAVGSRIDGDGDVSGGSERTEIPGALEVSLERTQNSI